tara:strand:+ start:37 stop:267 length:231 start_codon:yes stop_codon:yes gene_type:complete
MKLESVFDPLPVEYCNYFYFLMFFGFFLVLLGLANLVQTLFSKKGEVFTSIMILLQSGLFYFVNRLLYTMCARSLA